MGVIGTYSAPGISDHSRHKYIYFQAARVRVRPNQRPQTRPCWYARIGNFEKQSECLVYVTSHLWVEVIEGINGYLFRSKRKRRDRIPVHLPQRPQCQNHKLRGAHQQFRRGITLDGDTATLKVFLDMCGQQIADHRFRRTIRMRPCMTRPRDHHDLRLSPIARR
ncbi:hypothetical protein LX82_03418 [Celeribacter halophilus]|nr:hypothetical protein LX82_03418 [Celeribacter halophilus]